MNSLREPRRATLLPYLLCMAAGLAGCAPEPPPVLPPPARHEPAAVERQEQTARETYVASVLDRPVPAELKGLRPMGKGTGFYVAPKQLVTNFHVAGECKAITTGNGTEGQEVVAHLLAGDSQADLALLGVELEGEPAAFQTELTRETGRDLAILGYPAHGMAVRLAELSPATAEPRALLGNRANYPFYGEVHPGNSGSPVLDGSGDVIGVVVKKVDTVAVYQHTGDVIDNIGFAIANHVVLPFLEANHVAIRQAEPGPALPRQQLLDKAHQFVRQITCWR